MIVRPNLTLELLDLMPVHPIWADEANLRQDLGRMKKGTFRKHIRLAKKKGYLVLTRRTDVGNGRAPVLAYCLARGPHIKAQAAAADYVKRREEAITTTKPCPGCGDEISDDDERCAGCDECGLQQTKTENHR